MFDSFARSNQVRDMLRSKWNRRAAWRPFREKFTANGCCQLWNAFTCDGANEHSLSRARSGIIQMRG